jgi:hypothetical protein
MYNPVTESCGNCKFYADYYEPHENAVGVCRRYPRVLMDQDSGSCYYIDVRNLDDWCGEWKPIPGQPVTKPKDRFEDLDVLDITDAASHK